MTDIDWGKVNVPISPEKFDNIYNKMTAYLQGREIFIFDGFAGADPKYALSVRVVNELASPKYVHAPAVAPPHQGAAGRFCPRLHHHRRPPASSASPRWTASIAKPPSW